MSENLREKIPSLPIQWHIADIFSTLDGAIKQTEAMITKYKHIKMEVMHDLLTRGVTLDGKLRSTRDRDPDLYKESPLGWIPKEWETATLSDKVGVGEAA